jgi:hypothetical protein
MTAIAEYTPEVRSAPTEPRPRSAEAWPLAERIAFRFCFVYFGLYVLTTQMFRGMIPLPKIPFFDLGKISPMRPLVMWVGHNLLGVKPVLIPTGSGDTTYDWTQLFTILLLAVASTALWSLVARDTLHHDRLYKWFRLFLRFALGTTMLSYGFAKVFPLQMPTLFLSRLLEPYGNFSPMGVIWYSIGAAPGYERFIGFGEVLGGTLLFLPRTALLGGLITLGMTTGVFVVNMTYDVPVKQFSFHLILMSLFLIAPDLRRLLNVFALNRTAEPSTPPQFGRSARSNRIWLGAQFVFAVWVLGWEIYGGSQSWKSRGGGAPKSALYGIWDVDSMSIDGQVHPPLLTDSARFSHLVFQATTRMTAQQMDQSFVGFGAQIDTVKHTIALKKPADGTWKATLAYQRPTPTRLTLEGDMDGKHVQMQLSLHDLNKFLLVSRGFNWVQELPFNR